MIMKTLFSLALLLMLSGAVLGVEPNRAPATLPNDAAVLARLERLRGVHPRLYLDAKRLAALREAVKTTHAPLWARLRLEADQLAKKGPPAYRADKDPEQLWQRSVGNAMPTLAMAWLVSGERRYLSAAHEWALASCGYETWGLGRQNGLDLAAGHQLYGLALVYDWCYRDMDDATRKTIRDTLEKRGGALYEAGLARHMGADRSYLQNHLWVKTCGLAVAGLAVFDEVKGAGNWATLTLDKWQHTHAALGPDGASHEGVGYWEYGAEYLLKFMWLARDLFGVDFYDHPWWRNTADYALYLGLPRHSWTPRNCIVDIADCPRYHWYGPDYSLRALAHEFRNDHAQWLAQEIDAANVDTGGARWLNLLWFDPAIAPRPPVDLPTLRHFTDMELVSARSDWSGGESLVVFKCGPFVGHEAVKKFDFDPGGGHVHPDANHFVIFGDGEWLVRDDGYRSKAAAQHNTLLIDGAGQIGEGAKWFDGKAALAAKSQPRVLFAGSTPALDHIVGDATEAYPRDAGLKHFVRHLLFLKPNVVIVADDIALSANHTLELRFHPESTATRQADGAFVARGEKTVLRIEPLTLDKVEVSTGEDKAEGHNEGASTLLSVRLQSKRNEWRNAVAISWSPEKSQPARVRLTPMGQRWVFNCGTHDVTLDWQTGDARVTR